MNNKLTAEQELLSTKDNDNILNFHNDDYFYNKDGCIKRKYSTALNKLSKENIIKFKGKYNGTNWSFAWVVQC